MRTKQELIDANLKTLHLMLDGLKNYNFEKFGVSREHSTTMDDLIYEYDDKKVPLSDWFNGATKAVLQPKGKDFVLKIPFEGEWQEDWCYNEENDDYDLIEEYFCEFQGSGGVSNDWDYCQREVELYNLAAEAGLGEIFVETFFVDYVNGHPVYAQQRVDKVGGWNGKSDEERSSTRDKLSKAGQHAPMDLDWVATFLEFYDEELLFRLFKFLDEEWIDDDLHNGNIGYLNGRPVIFDYAGFRE